MACISYNEINSCNDTFSTLGNLPYTFVAQKVGGDFQFRGIQGDNVTQSADIVTIATNPPIPLPPPIPNIGLRATIADASYFLIPPIQRTDEFDGDFINGSIDFDNTGLIIGNDIVVVTPGYYKISITGSYGNTLTPLIYGYLTYRIRNIANDIVLELNLTTDENEEEDCEGIATSIVFLPADAYRLTYQALGFSPTGYDNITFVSARINMQLISI